MKILKAFLLLLFLFLAQGKAFSQQRDTVIITHDTVLLKSPLKDSSALKLESRKKKNDPGKASLYSAIFPGLGQIHNKKYWKAPIVWAAVGIPTYSFFFNRTWYNRSRYALAVLVNGSQFNPDSLRKVNPLFLNAIQRGDAQAIQNSRDYYRKNEDYSVLFFLLFYALNIVDATVDAHLKDFNVSSDLSFSIHPGIPEGTSIGGLSVVFDIHKPKTKLYTLP